MSSRFLKWLLGTVAVLIVVAGLLLGGFRIAMHYVPEYRVQVQEWLNERTGLVFEFGELRARWRFYGPELVFDDAVVRTPDRTAVLAAARRGSVGFDVWNALRTGHLSAGRFALIEPEIGVIRTPDGRIQLVGQSVLEQDSKPFALERLPTGRFHVSNARITFRDAITGRGPWPVSGVTLDLYRRSTALVVQGRASLPDELGTALEFTANAVGAIEHPGALETRFTLSGTDLDLAGWAELVPEKWPVAETGRGDVHVEAEMLGPQLRKLHARADFKALTAVMPAWSVPLPTPAPMQQPGGGRDEDERDAPVIIPATAASASAVPRLLSYERVAFVLDAHSPQPHAWQLVLSDVELSRVGSPWQAEQVALRWQRDAQSVQAFAVSADRIELQNLWPLLAYAPQSEQFARLRALGARGTLSDLDVEARREADTWRYSLAGRVADLSFAPIERMPGLSGVSGEVRGTEAGGEGRIDARNLAIDLPHLFRAPIELRSIAGAVSWQRQAAGWQVAGQQIALENEDGRAQAQFALRLADTAGVSPYLEFEAQAQDLQAQAARKYMPAGKLGPGALAWLDRAFVAGVLPTATVSYSGPVRSFPFRNGEGEFLARARAEGVTFDYQPGWRPATAVSADVEFRNAGMTVSNATGMVHGLKVFDAGAQIGDFKRGDLAVHAQTSGDLGHALSLLQSSPMAEHLGRQFSQLHGSGPTTSSVQLFFPLKDLPRRRIDVRTQLNNATVVSREIALPITQLTGSLRVADNTVSAATLDGRWMGGPLRVRVSAGEGAPELVASGRAGASQLSRLLSLPAAVRLSGATRWNVIMPLDVRGGALPASRILVEADLNGLGVDLPEPLGKTAAADRPLRIEIEQGERRSLQARAAYGSLRALLRLRAAASGWEFERGGVRVDGLLAALPDHRGLRIEGEIPQFVLDEWLALRDANAGERATARQPFNALLHAANVRVGRFEYLGYRWPDVRGVLQATEDGWRVDVDGPNAVGRLNIPADMTGPHALVGQFERLKLSKAEGPQRAARDRAQADPRTVPNVQLRVDELHLDAQALGTVELKLSRVAQGVNIDQLTVANAAMRGTARGNWLNVTGGGQRTSLSAHVTSHDVGAALRALDYTAFMDAKLGEVRADLHWPGGFEGNIIGRASGTLTVNAENGQLVSVEPGAGRILGLFSVAALPRRLSLDFSDLTEKGLSFDSVYGDFELRDGNAFTSNLLLRGPAAEIGIAGRTGLGLRDYDQTAVVTGNLGASLPVAGALAGGPVVGAAVLLFSQVFKEPLKGIARGYYRITGPWDEPRVERVDAAQVKEVVSEQNMRSEEQG